MTQTATLEYQSKHLGHRTRLAAVLPAIDVPRPWPVIYLLHGLSDDEKGWLNYTNLAGLHKERPELKGIALLLPDGGRGWYVDHETGPAWGTHLTEEVTAVAESTFGLDGSRRAIAGNSMGGYGSLRVVLDEPDRWKAAAPFSGAFGVAQRDDPHPAFQPGEFRAIFGTDSKNTHRDVIARLADVEHLPPLWIDCGVGDFCIEENRQVHAALEARGIDHAYHEHEGRHDWNTWNRRLPDALAFLAQHLA